MKNSEIIDKYYRRNNKKAEIVKNYESIQQMLTKTAMSIRMIYREFYCEQMSYSYFNSIIKELMSEEFSFAKEKHYFFLYIEDVLVEIKKDRNVMNQYSNLIKDGKLKTQNIEGVSYARYREFVTLFFEDFGLNFEFSELIFSNSKSPVRKSIATKVVNNDDSSVEVVDKVVDKVGEIVKVERVPREEDQFLNLDPDDYIEEVFGGKEWVEANEVEDKEYMRSMYHYINDNLWDIIERRVFYFSLDNRDSVKQLECLKANRNFLDYDLLILFGEGQNGFHRYIDGEFFPILGYDFDLSDRYAQKLKRRATVNAWALARIYCGNSSGS